MQTLDKYENDDDINNVLRMQPLKKVGLLANEIEPQAIEWLWKDRLPRAKWCMVVGEEGVGKSFLAAFLTAHITTGCEWPDGSPCPIGGVVIVSPEDGASDTIVPRLIDAGANLSKVCLLETAIDKTARVQSKGEVPFSIPEHLDTLIEAIRGVKAKLVILDTLEMSTSIDLNHKSIKEMFILPVLKLCRDMGVTVLGINHPRTGSYNQRNLRSKIFGNPVLNKTSRLTYYAAPDEENPSIITLKEIKRNLPGKCEPFSYRITSNLNGAVFVEMVTGNNINNDEKVENYRLSFLKQQILAYMKYRNVPIEPLDVAQDLGINHNTVKSYMRRLIDEKIIQSYAYGLYGLENSTNDPLQPVQTQASTSTEENTTEDTTKTSMVESQNNVDVVTP